MKTLGKIFGKLIRGFFCAVVFLIVFGISTVVKLSSLTGIDANSFTLQNKGTEAVKYEGEILREKHSISYITNEGTIDERQIIVLKPAGVAGDLPLIYIPHYEIDENTADFQQYMNHGWAVASPVFSNKYNSEVTGNDLVFNNAALYQIRHMDGIDKERIAVVGGSAGGYMSLMLNMLQMGTCASIANSPIANVYYNLYVYFHACDELNKDSPFGSITMPIQMLISKSFRPNLDNFPDVQDADRWAALSPIGLAKCISNPVVVNHYTGDILVPVDQITKKYTYAERNKAFPADFPIMMGSDYPGILSHSLEEEADPDEICVQYYKLENQNVDMEMTASDKLLTINIFDDGPMNPKGTHTAPGTTGNLDTMKFLEEMFEKTLKGTEKAESAKLILMLERYAGESVQLPPHEGIDDTIYGSFAVYRQEVIEELRAYVVNNSFEALDDQMETAIANSKDPGKFSQIWKVVKAKVKADIHNPLYLL